MAAGPLEERIASMRRAQLELELEIRRCYSVMRLTEKRCERLIADIERKLEALRDKASGLN